MRNHKMMNYGFEEATAFEGVMPKVAEKVGSVGASKVVVPMHGMEVNGMDALEVIDVQAAFGAKEEGAVEEEVETPSDEPTTNEPVEG